MPAERPSYAQAARSLLRETLLDAARGLLHSRRWSEITMAHIAAGGGVSRQTLYNEFGSREEFAQALVLREVDDILTLVEESVRAHADDPATALAAAFDTFLAAISQHPLVRALASGDSAAELLPLVTTAGEPVLERATTRLAGFLATTWPIAPRDRVDLLAVCVVRLAISVIALPSHGTELTGPRVAELLGPYIESVLDAAAAASSMPASDAVLPPSSPQP